MSHSPTPRTGEHMGIFLGRERGGFRGDAAGERSWTVLGRAGLQRAGAAYRMEGLAMIREHWLSGVIAAFSYVGVFIVAARMVHG